MEVAGSGLSQELPLLGQKLPKTMPAMVGWICTIASIRTNRSTISGGNKVVGLTLASVILTDPGRAAEIASLFTSVKSWRTRSQRSRVSLGQRDRAPRSF